jgi:adenylate kinase family enzyme
VIVPLLKNKIDEKKTDATGFLIDGFPREVGQAELFEKEIGMPSHILFCECSEETMKARLMKRGETSGRVDDNEEVFIILFIQTDLISLIQTIKKRFETFTTQSVPVVERYKQNGIVSIINGNGTQDEAYAQVKTAVDKLMA